MRVVNYLGGYALLTLATYLAVPLLPFLLPFPFLPFLLLPSSFVNSSRRAIGSRSVFGVTLWKCIFRNWRAGKRRGGGWVNQDFIVRAGIHKNCCACPRNKRSSSFRRRAAHSKMLYSCVWEVMLLARHSMPYTAHQMVHRLSSGAASSM